MTCWSADEVAVRVDQLRKILISHLAPDVAEESSKSTAAE